MERVEEKWRRWGSNGGDGGADGGANRGGHCTTSLTQAQREGASPSLLQLLLTSSAAPRSSLPTLLSTASTTSGTPRAIATLSSCGSPSSSLPSSPSTCSFISVCLCSETMQAILASPKGHVLIDKTGAQENKLHFRTLKLFKRKQKVQKKSL